MNIEIDKEFASKVKRFFKIEDGKRRRKRLSWLSKKNINKSYYILLVFMIGLASLSTYTNIRRNKLESILESDVAPVFSNEEKNVTSNENKVEKIIKKFPNSMSPPVKKDNIKSCAYNDGITKIQVSPDEKILSVADGGVVENIYLDYCYGYTVVVKYSDNIKCKYSNLSDDIYVTFNQTLKKGDVIGRSISYSLMDESYIYFSAYYDNEPVNINSLMGI